MVTAGTEKGDRRLRRTAAVRELGEAMRRLKEASGKSYESLSRRSLVSASTLHRYCRGEISPPTFAVVELFARACAATPAQIGELRDLWTAVPLVSRDATDAPKRPAPR